MFESHLLGTDINGGLYRLNLFPQTEGVPFQTKYLECNAISLYVYGI